MCTFLCVISTENNVPSSPANPPKLTPIETSSAGQYNFDIGTQGQSEMIGSANDIQPSLHTTFILKVENDSNSYYQLVYLF